PYLDCVHSILRHSMRVDQYQKSVFADQLTGPSGIVDLMDDLGEALTLSDDLIMMGGGNPAHIPQLQKVWRELVSEQLSANGDWFDRVLNDYDQPAGSPAFRDAVAAFLSETYGWKVERQNIAITPGGQTAFFFLLNRFAGRMANGDERQILVPVVPEYIGYADQGVSDAPLFSSRKPQITLRGDREFNYGIDFDNLHLGKEHGAVVFSRPTNPSSNVLTDAEVSKLSSLASEAGIPLLVDNAYGHPFPGAIFGDVTPIWDEHIILTMSLSKLGLPGTRTGIVVAHEDVIRELRSMNAIIGLANNNIGQALVRPLLETGKIQSLCQDVVRPFYEERSQIAKELVAEILPTDVPWRYHASEGAFFLWMWFEGLPITTRELYEKLKHRGLVAVPGAPFFFGLPEGDNDWAHRDECLRVTFTQPVEILRKGFSILGEVLAEVYSD
ncbi:MAG: valine--pyruvate transaminase, partial [Verrucomicrobiota bacterium]